MVLGIFSSWHEVVIAGPMLLALLCFNVVLWSALLLSPVLLLWDAAKKHREKKLPKADAEEGNRPCPKKRST